MAQQDLQFHLRFPADVKAFVEQQARRNGSSQTSEIIRSIRDRMDRMKAQASPSVEQQLQEG